MIDEKRLAQFKVGHHCSGMGEEAPHIYDEGAYYDERGLRELLRLARLGLEVERYRNVHGENVDRILSLGTRVAKLEGLLREVASKAPRRAHGERAPYAEYRLYDATMNDIRTTLAALPGEG